MIYDSVKLASLNNKIDVKSVYPIDDTQDYNDTGTKSYWHNIYIVAHNHTHIIFQDTEQYLRKDTNTVNGCCIIMLHLIE